MWQRPSACLHGYVAVAGSRAHDDYKTPGAEQRARQCRPHWSQSNVEEQVASIPSHVVCWVRSCGPSSIKNIWRTFFFSEFPSLWHFKDWLFSRCFWKFSLSLLRVYVTCRANPCPQAIPWGNRSKKQNL